MRPPRNRPFGVLALLVVLLLASAGCGGESGSEGESGGSASGGGGGETASTGGSASGGGGSTSGGETTSSTSGSASGSASAKGAGAGEVSGEGLVVYSGRNEELVGPIIEQFEEESGIDVQVRYGDTAELAATILEEGDNSPADVFFSQDAGALGALADAGRLGEVPEGALGRVEERFKDPEGRWVGVSGRARVAAYNTEVLGEGELPDSVLGFAEPEWQGRIGWAPTNASFQAFVTALRLVEGEEAAREWLEGVQANDPQRYENNLAVLEGIASGEVDVGLVNHYYLFQAREEAGGDIPVANYFFGGGDPGSLVNVAGIGLLNTGQRSEEAEAFLDFMLSEQAQGYFAGETFEYPLVQGVPANEELPPLAEIESPGIDLSDLDDLQGTLDLLRETGVL